MKLVGRLREHVLEAAESASPTERDAQLLGQGGIGHRVEEHLHVAVTGARSDALDEQPAVRVAVRVVVGHLVDDHGRPRLPGLEVETAAAVDDIAFEQRGQLVEIDRQWPEHRSSPGQCGLELVGELRVSGPATHVQRRGAPGGHLPRSGQPIVDGRDERVSDQLQDRIGGSSPHQIEDRVGTRVQSGTQRPHRVFVPDGVHRVPTIIAPARRGIVSAFRSTSSLPLATAAPSDTTSAQAPYGPWLPRTDMKARHSLFGPPHGRAANPVAD
ncbi:hypothetical protein [Rhodococcus aetherivorans]|uniref:hypothetical protein n=1 Tax=Rhodococcus aetherivorans TaxID=191292 RepID=UPI0018CA5C1B|nr:hypothetical protein [Rhodococcus aetherivorans]